MKRLTPGMLAAIGIAFFTFAAAAVISKDVFERLPHLEDEFGYLYQAKIFAGGHAWVPRNEPVKNFWQPFIIQPETSPDNVQKRFGKYTPGWPLLLTLGVLIGQPWMVTAGLGMFSVALVYRLGREIFDETVGVVSALLLAISPMPLLLNATLMSHVPAMFLGVLFVYCYWRLTRHDRRRYFWAVAAGLTLGWLIATRPLSAIAIAAPVILHAGSRAIDSLFNKEWRTKFLPTLKPLLVLSLFVIPTAGLWPLFNQIWTGDWRTNTYTLLWSYDTPGFGPEHGLMPGGHTIEYGWRNARTDMVVYFQDLFGLTSNPDVAKYLAVNVFGLTTAESDVPKVLNENFIWGMLAGLSWLPIAAGLMAGRKSEWIWLFFEIFIAVVIAQMTYWIGSVVYGGAAYSLRYWYEGTFGVCLVAGYGAVAFARTLHHAPATPTASTSKIAYLNGLTPATTVPIQVRAPTFAQRIRQLWNTLWPGYIILLVVCGFSLIGFTPARFKESLPGWPDGLFRYNKVGQNQLDAIYAMRDKYGQPGQHVLIVVLRNPDSHIEDNWRDYGAAMAVTSPYLDSDIIVARVFESVDAPELVKRFPGRLVLYQIGENLYTSPDEAIASEKAKQASLEPPSN